LKLLDIDFVLTVDRTLMTDHHGKEFIGFMTTAPPVFFPEKLWMWIAAPKPKVDEYGRPVVAPYGLRKVEASLLEKGFKVAVIDPDYLEPYLERVKAVMIGHHDYFAFCPPSSEWWMLTGREPVNRRYLLRLMRLIARVKKTRNPDLKVIVAGPAAWQWLYVPDYVDEFMVDCIVEGESGEKAIPWLAQRILDGEELPRYLYVGPADSPSVEEIPVIKGLSVNGLIEVSRGCPRGCKFCSVTLRPFRHIPLDKIEAELRLHAEHGVHDGILHAEDVLLYGAVGVNVNPDAVLKLHALTKKYYKSFGWSHAALATVVQAQRRFKLISRLADMIFDEHMDFLGFQTGIETGSPRLVERDMRGKAAPYTPREWPDIVEEAFSILHEHNMIPAATLIIGLPGETEDDVYKTIELVERLKPYRSMIIPLFFVPMGAFRRKDWFLSIQLREEHAELLRICLLHSIRWAKEIIGKYMPGLRYAPVRWAMRLFLAWAEYGARRATAETILGFVEQAKERMARQEAREPLVKRIKARISGVFGRQPVEVPARAT